MIKTIHDLSLSTIIEHMLSKPFDEFQAAIHFVQPAVINACFEKEASSHSRERYLTALQQRLDELTANNVPSTFNKREIKEALGLAICHLQTGSLDKNEVVSALKNTLSNIRH